MQIYILWDLSCFRWETTYVYPWYRFTVHSRHVCMEINRCYKSTLVSKRLLIGIPLFQVWIVSYARKSEKYVLRMSLILDSRRSVLTCIFFSYCSTVSWSAFSPLYSQLPKNPPDIPFKGIIASDGTERLGSGHFSTFRHRDEMWAEHISSIFVFIRIANKYVPADTKCTGCVFSWPRATV